MMDPEERVRRLKKLKTTLRAGGWQSVARHLDRERVPVTRSDHGVAVLIRPALPGERPAAPGELIAYMDKYGIIATERHLLRPKRMVTPAPRTSSEGLDRLHIRMHPSYVARWKKHAKFRSRSFAGLLRLVLVRMADVYKDRRKLTPEQLGMLLYLIGDTDGFD